VQAQADIGEPLAQRRLEAAAGGPALGAASCPDESIAEREGNSRGADTKRCVTATSPKDEQSSPSSYQSSRMEGDVRDESG